MERRSFLKSAAAFGALFTAGLSNLMTRTAAATDRMAKVVFEATREDEILNILFPGIEAEQSDSVRVAAPYLITPRQAMVVKVG